jgi:FkbM family methyltransferase
MEKSNNIRPGQELKPMPHPSPEQCPVSDGQPASAELYRTISVREGLCFQIAIGAEADDPFSQAFAQGKYPSGPLTDLMFQLVRPGDAVLDLGAHVGTFSLAAAALGSRVLSLEASPRNATLLQTSVRRNGFDNMRVVHGAVGDRAGVVQFIPNGPHGVVFTPAVDLPSVTVRAVTVDQLLAEMGWPGVNLIKMDVEGSEIAAVQGMARLLARADAPPIIYESNGYTLHLFDKTAHQLKRALEEFGYRNYLIESGQLIPIRARDLQPFVVVDHLAVKRWPSRLTDWQIRRRLGRAELLARFLTACAHAHQHVRGHAARELERAPRWLLAEPAIQSALLVLRNDPLAEVRDAAAWSSTRQPPATLVQKMSGLRHKVKRRLARWLRRSA